MTQIEHPSKRDGDLAAVDGITSAAPPGRVARTGYHRAEYLSKQRPEPQASGPERTEPPACTGADCPQDETGKPSPAPETLTIRIRPLWFFLGCAFLAAAIFIWLQGERTGFSAVCAGLGTLLLHLSEEVSEQEEAAPDDRSQRPDDAPAEDH